MTHYYPAIKSPIFNVSIRFACFCCCRLVRATGRSEINQVLLSWPHTLPHKYQITQTHAHIQTWNSTHSTEWTGYIYSYIHIYKGRIYSFAALHRWLIYLLAFFFRFVRLSERLYVPSTFCWKLQFFLYFFTFQYSSLWGFSLEFVGRFVCSLRWLVR